MDDWTFYSYFCFFILDTDEYFNDFILALTERNQRLDYFQLCIWENCLIIKGILL